MKQTRYLFGAWISDSPLFKSLDQKEVQEFSKYAVENDPPDLKNWEIYHPVCRDTWTARGISPYID